MIRLKDLQYRGKNISVGKVISTDFSTYLEKDFTLFYSKIRIKWVQNGVNVEGKTNRDMRLQACCSCRVYARLYISDAYGLW